MVIVLPWKKEVCAADADAGKTKAMKASSVIAAQERSGKFLFFMTSLPWFTGLARHPAMAGARREAV
jgi:hypothetical protein